MSKLLAVLALLALAGCSGAPAPASVPASVAPASASLRGDGSLLPVSTVDPASPSAQPASTAPLGGLAEVIVDELVVRSAPGTGTDSQLHPGYLRDGQRLWLVDGPVAASGYEWYQVVSEVPPLIDDDAPVRSGWIAAGSREGEPWVRSVTPTCPTEVDLGTLSGMSNAERIACLSGSSIELEGWVPPIWGSGGCGAEEPGWLTCFLAETPLVNVEPPAAALADPAGAPGWDDDAARIALNVPPQLGPLLLSAGDHVSVVGHVNDDAAAGCRVQRLDEDGETTFVAEPFIVYECRGQFVVETVTRLD